MRTDEAVRSALLDLAGEAQAVDLTRAALAGGQRRRRRQRQLMTSAAAAVTMAVVLAGYLAPDRRVTAVPTVAGQLEVSAATVTPPTKPLAPAGEPTELIKGWYAQGLSTNGKQQAMVLDLVHHRYVPVSGDRVWPSATGDAVAFTAKIGSSTISVTQFRTGRTTTATVPGRIGDPQWSPDGRRLLFTAVDEENGRLEARILNIGTGGVTSFPVGVPNNSCVRCGLTWLPDGQRIAVPQTDLNGSAIANDVDRQSGMELFSDAGTRLEFLGVRGWVTGTYAWSPDLHYVVVVGTALHDGHWREVPMLVDVSTGATIREVLSADAYWVDNTRALYLLEPDDDPAAPDPLAGYRVALRALDGTLIDQWSTDKSWSVQTLAHT